MEPYNEVVKLGGKGEDILSLLFPQQHPNFTTRT